MRFFVAEEKKKGGGNKNKKKIFSSFLFLLEIKQLLTINNRHLFSLMTPKQPITATTNTKHPAPIKTYEDIGYVTLVNSDTYLCFSMTLHTPTARTEKPAVCSEINTVSDRLLTD